MSRVDKPVLKCDRLSCGKETEDKSEMGRFMVIYNDHMSGRDHWDLCPECAKLFRDFIGGGKGLLLDGGG